MSKILSLYKCWQWLIIVIAIAVNIFIIVSSCLPAKESTKESGWVVDLLKNVINTFSKDAINESNYGSFSSFVRKFVGHFSMFVLSGFFSTITIKIVYYNNKHRYWYFVLYSCITGLFLAFLTEFIQLFVEGRSGEFKDVGIDFMGYSIGLIIISIIVKIKEKKISKIEIEK